MNTKGDKIYRQVKQREQFSKGLQTQIADNLK